MVKITEFCTVETLLTSDKSNKTNVKFEINVKKFPNQKILLGMQIGERFRKCDIAKFCRDKETEYEIINIRPHLTEKEILRIL